jgi:hypothetical protein
VSAAAGADADRAAAASAAFAAGEEKGRVSMAKTTHKNAQPIILVFRVGKIFFFCNRVVSRSVYQRQPLQLHHGEIQGKKHDAKDDERGNER